MGTQEQEVVRPWVSHLGEFLHEMPTAVLILDRAGIVTQANPAAERLFGGAIHPRLTGLRYDDPRIFGQLELLLFDERDQLYSSPTEHPIAAALETGTPASGVRLTVRRPRAGRAYLSTDIVPLHTDLGGLAGVGLLCTDATGDVARRSESDWLQQELVTARGQLEEALRFSEALNAIGQAIHSSLDFDVILETVVRTATEAIGAASSLIEVREADGWRVRVAHGLPEQIRGQSFDLFEARHASLVAETTRPVMVWDSFEDDRFDHDFVRKFHIRGFITVPLVSRGDVVAALSFHNPVKTHFTNAQSDFASKVATTTSLAMENARTYTAEHHISETLQRALLAVPARIEGIAFGHAYRSATEEAWVGGDFFDLFELPARRVGILIGDVSGKGVEASALASFTRQLLIAHATEDASPARVMAKTNELVRLVTEPENFVTVFFGVLSLDDGQLLYSSAGHPPPVRFCNRHSSLLEGAGTILGAFEGVEYREFADVLSPGELLVLYTDGVVEAKRDGELLGNERLLDLVDATAEQTSVEHLAEALVTRVADYTMGHLRDDVAILALRRD